MLGLTAPKARTKHFRSSIIIIIIILSVKGTISNVHNAQNIKKNKKIIVNMYRINQFF